MFIYYLSRLFYYYLMLPISILHLRILLELPDGGAAERVRQAAAEQNIAVQTLDSYFAGPPSVHGLVIGYGAASLTDIKKAAAVVRDLLLTNRGGERRPDGEARLRFRLGLSVSADRDQVGISEPVGVDGTRAEALAFRNLRGAEVPAPRPQRGDRGPVSSPVAAGGPAGQRRGTFHASSQPSIAASPGIGPLVNGSPGLASTPICAQIRPLELTAGISSTTP